MKKILPLVLILFAGSHCNAETVSQKQASGIASLFFNALFGEVTPAPKLAWNGRQLTTDRLFSPFYVYNHPRGGFVIIPADSKAFPVLAYSRHNKFQLDALNDDVRELLGQYAREIEIIRYDSRVPERASLAWQNIPEYISGVIANPYATPEYDKSSTEKKELLEAADRRLSAVFLPNAVEFPVYSPEQYRELSLEDALLDRSVENEVPFSFYENFIKDIEKENLARQASFDEIISPSKPVVEYLGGAHFKIRFPEGIGLARVYGLNGSMAVERHYGFSNIVNLDISSLPSGYYVLMALSENGKVYGLKIFR